MVKINVYYKFISTYDLHTVYKSQPDVYSWWYNAVPRFLRVFPVFHWKETIKNEKK